MAQAQIMKSKKLLQFAKNQGFKNAFIVPFLKLENFNQ